MSIADTGYRETDCISRKDKRMVRPVEEFQDMAVRQLVD